MSAHTELIDALFSAIDRMDAVGFVSHLTDDARFVFGNQPEVRGGDAIRAAVQGFFDLLGGVSHSIGAVVESSGLVALEGTVTYRRNDGSTLSLPFADFLFFRDGRVSDYRIYIDVTPLWASPAPG